MQWSGFRPPLNDFFIVSRYVRTFSSFISLELSTGQLNLQHVSSIESIAIFLCFSNRPELPSSPMVWIPAMGALRIFSLLPGYVRALSSASSSSTHVSFTFFPWAGLPFVSECSCLQSEWKPLSGLSMIPCIAWSFSCMIQENMVKHICH